MRKQTKTQRILALLLCALMTVSMLSLSAFAEGTDPFQGTSVTLGSDLLVNFYAQVTDSQNASMTFVVGETTHTVPAAQAQKTADGLYRFSCPVAPTQMTETVQATLTDSGNTYRHEASVRSYASTLLASRQWDLLAANDIMTATLNYGAAAQSYFGYRTGELANAGYEQDATGAIPSKTGSSSGSVTGAHYYGATLVFRSLVAVRFYFIGSVDGLTFQIGEQTFTPVEKDGLYYVEFADINPQDYEKDICLTVSDGENSLNVTYSPVCYLSRIHGKTDDTALKALMSYMYDYYQAAISYLEDPYGNGQDNLIFAQ